jgi:hypothetical protein
MGVREQIRESDEYQAQVQQNQQDQAGQGGSQSQGQGQATTVGEALGPVMDWEKSDVEFWMQVGQFVLLLLILRELRGGGY